VIRTLDSTRIPSVTGGALLLAAAGARAHGLWIEPGHGGYKVFFGEPEHNLREKKDKLGRFAAANLNAPVREPRVEVPAPDGWGRGFIGSVSLKF
jgi:hypothetical protein